MSDTVLLEVECGRCHRTHDVFGEQLENDSFNVEARDLRCPACDARRPSSIRPRESLA